MVESTDIYVSVTCLNELNFKVESSVMADAVLSRPPSSERALVHIHPRQYSYFFPRNASQLYSNVLEFSFSNFGDIANIEYYQYLLQSDDSGTDWISIGKMVNIHFLNLICKPCVKTQIKTYIECTKRCDYILR